MYLNMCSITQLPFLAILFITHIFVYIALVHFQLFGSVHIVYSVARYLGNHFLLSYTYSLSAPCELFPSMCVTLSSAGSCCQHLGWPDRRLRCEMVV